MTDISQKQGGWTPGLSERFWKRVEKSDGCWTWVGAKGGRGYGQLWRDGRVDQAHRVGYELQVGPIPDGLVIDHLCKNPSCVRASHMEAVTQAENTRRGKVGVVHPNSTKTHCQNGHELTANNLRPDPSGRRQCRTCAQIRDRERRARAALSRANPSTDQGGE